MAVVGSGLSIVKNGLIGYPDIKDLLQDKSRFTSSNGKGDMKSENEA